MKKKQGLQYNFSADMYVHNLSYALFDFFLKYLCNTHKNFSIRDEVD